MNQEFFMYRGYPLVRKGNEIYYGYMSEPFVVMMQIVHQQEVNGLLKEDRTPKVPLEEIRKINEIEI